MALLAKISQTLKKETVSKMSILHKLFQKIEEKRALPVSFYKLPITLIPKADKDITSNYYLSWIYT